MGKPITTPGFASPARDYQQKSIDLNEILTPHPSCTFPFKVVGNGMCEAFVPDPSTVLVDRSEPIKNGDLVLCQVGGEFYVRRYVVDKAGKVLLQACDTGNKIKPIDPANEEGCSIEGLVTWILIDTRTLKL